MSRKFKYAVKRPKVSKKDIGRGLKRVAKGGIKARDIGRAVRSAKKKHGGVPRLPGIMQGRSEQRHSAAGRAQMQAARDKIYGMLDGGTERTMYISGPGPKRRESESKQSRSSAPSYDMEASYMDQMVYDFQQQREGMMAQYEQMMAEQARQAEEQRRQMEAAMRAQAQNAYSASLQPSFQLQGAGETPKLSGIQQFKRRTGSQFGTASPYTGLAKIQSGMVNA